MPRLVDMRRLGVYLLAYLLKLHISAAATWEEFGESLYTFVLDTEKSLDTTRDEAFSACATLGASLVSINSHEELRFLQKRIRFHVEKLGQRFAHEQWWTSGRRRNNRWLWDDSYYAGKGTPISMELWNPEHDQDNQWEFIVILHDLSGWRLKTLPRNFRLRYICEKTNYQRRPRPAEERLLRDLFREYDVDARGTLRAGSTVTVSISLILLRVQALDERSQVLVTTGLIITEWVDERLVWDPRRYDNLTDIVVRADRIWLPELAVMNGADEMMNEFEKIRVLVSNNGKVHWEPGGNFRTTCDIDITYFPFDEQKCPIRIGAWAYYSAKMNLTNAKPKVETKQFSLNGEWHLVNTSVKWQEIDLPCCPDMRYPYVSFTLHLQRRYTFYSMNIIIPCVLLSCLIMMIFWVPPDVGEKITAGISVLLAFAVFLLMIADSVPRTSLNVPILVIYLTSTMTLGTLSVCLTVLVLNIHFKGGSKPVPKWVKVILLGHVATFLGLHLWSTSPARERRTQIDIKKAAIEDSSPSDSKLSSPNHATEEHLTKDSSPDTQIPELPEISLLYTLPHRMSHLNNSKTAKEWQDLARVLDRVFFLIILIAMILGSTLILLLPWYKR